MNAYLVFRLIFILGQKWQPESSSGIYSCFHFLGCAMVYEPLQTQAVTYIVQRMTSLAALFFLLSTISYNQMEIRAVNRRDAGSIRLSRFAVVFSHFGTKENTFILPAVFVVYELYSVNGLLQLRSKAPTIGWLGLGSVILGFLWPATTRSLTRFGWIMRVETLRWVSASLPNLGSLSSI
jgi:hypothetical protein